MKRIEALRIILAWWAFAYQLQDDETALCQPLDWVLGETQDYRIPQAALVWFGTVSPTSTAKGLFINVWGETIRDHIAPNIPKYMLGQESLDDLITETIL